ncbi:hypothetical protein JRO89_XS05G0093500 [Xanthoceras sorbifolium]|uniref:RING-type domain-containing protein n=1 Tax=Xanthoceras sorbifolium TaxID=99658 RepID=A0ABQ8I168_9ROSI|nr:hypothetical protein JRO89_XS05G0093500 [Xanthoceras sorbifolium]
MGLSNFPSAAEGVLPVLVMNTVLSVALLKSMVRSVLQVMGATTWRSSSSSPSSLEEDPDVYSNSPESARERSISIIQFKSLCKDRSGLRSSSSSSCCGSTSGWAAAMECCVCLSGFEADEEVSELSCKHFFHKGCLDKWFDNKHSTCPLCRSIL